MSSRIPVHFDGICPYHNEPVVRYDMCDYCVDEEKLKEQLPDPFDEVCGG